MSSSGKVEVNSALVECFAFVVVDTSIGKNSVEMASRPMQSFTNELPTVEK